MVKKGKNKAKGRPARKGVREVAPTPKAGGEASRPQRGDEGVDFRSEYRYVYSDLQKIGVLASIMFVVLIALALLVRV